MSCSCSTRPSPPSPSTPRRSGRRPSAAPVKSVFRTFARLPRFPPEAQSRRALALAQGPSGSGLARLACQGARRVPVRPRRG